MLRLTFPLLLAAVCGACGGGSPAPDAAPSRVDAGRADTTPAPAMPSPSALDDTVAVRLGRTATVPGSALRVTFQRVVSDSRCPINAVCVWEGDAAVAVRLEGAGPAIDTTLHTSPRGGPSTVAIAGRELQLFGLTPAPVADQPRPSDESYEALFIARAK
jgi:hypothetical protein